MRLGTFTKADADRIDYDINYKKLGVLGATESIDSFFASVDGADQSLVVDSVQNTSTVGKVWLSGGTAGQTYTITTVMTTDQGRVKEDCFKVRVRAC